MEQKLKKKDYLKITNEAKSFQFLVTSISIGLKNDIDDKILLIRVYIENREHVIQY